MLADTLRYILLDLQYRLPDSICKGRDVSTAVTFDHYALQADQTCAVITTGIYLVIKRPYYRFGYKPCKSCKQRLGKFLLHIITQHPGHTFTGLQCHVTDEAVANDNIHPAGIDIITLDETNVVDVTVR